MAQKWNLQDIRPPDKSGGGERERLAPRRPRTDMVPPKRPKPIEKEYDMSDVSSIDVIDGNSQRKKRIVITVIVIAILIGAGILVNTLMGGAELTVHPKYKDVSVNASFTAYKDPAADQLGYEILSIDADGERQVTATSQVKSTVQATGVITIYNETSDPQRLIKNTRFESPDGLVFHITESAVVPGALEKDGQLVPGTVDAKVFADGPGEQYNLVAGTSFTVPGYKENGFSDLYKKVYGKNTDAFTGGFNGTKFLIPDSEMQTALQELQSELRNALLEKLPAQRPAGFVVYDPAVTFTFDTLPATKYGDKLATIKVKATLRVPMFKEDAFAKYIASNTVAGYEGKPVRIDDPSSLTFSYPNATTTSSDISTLDSIDFNLKGNARIIWTYDADKLKGDLKGLSKTALPTVLSGYPAIDRAEAVVRPFWRQSFPDKPSDITVKEVIQ